VVLYFCSIFIAVSLAEKNAFWQQVFGLGIFSYNSQSSETFKKIV